LQNLFQKVLINQIIVITFYVFKMAAVRYCFLLPNFSFECKCKFV